MAWNEPGGGKDRDPWGNRGRQGGPPDLDEVIRKLQAKLKGLFGGGATGGGSGPWSARGAPGRGTWAGIALILVIVIGWNMTYVVKQQEQGIVFRFGRLCRDLGSGLEYPLAETHRACRARQCRADPLDSSQRVDSHQR